MHFISRKGAAEFGGEWCITDWCPFNGRFCKLRDFVPYPHPPLADDPPRPPETAVPWREWEPYMVEPRKELGP